MPPRLSKRQQRERDELLSLAGSSVAQDVPEESTARELPPATNPKDLGFSALAQPEVDEDDEDDEDKDVLQKVAKKKNKKKKKKDTAAKTMASNIPQHEVTLSPGPDTPLRGGKKEKGKGDANKRDGDDLDRALAELSMKYPELQNIVRSSKGGAKAGTRSIADQQNALLAVSLPHLDSEAEMRKFFGAKVISASKAQVKQPRGARAAIQGLKSHLTKPQPTWWSASQREGLSIRPLTAEELEAKEEHSKIAINEKGERWWTVEYSKRYRNVTKAFVSAVMSGDPERFYRILSKLPWHADTLLQLSEVYRHREEHSSSVDYLNRAIFTYERSFIGAFTFTSGNNRLDFDCVENRPFYLALSRMVADLQRRGCSRTAFEFARLLFSLDPYTDPHGALLYLDYLAVKSGMHDWLLSMWDLHDSEAKADNARDVWHRFNVTVLPGWSYARALALKAREDSKESHELSTAALKEAVLAFPCVVSLLADKIDIFLPGELRGHPAFRVHVDASSLDGCDSLIHLLSHLYAHRSSSLWKIPDNASWLKETAVSVFQKFPTNRKSHSRHVRFEKQFGKHNALGSSVGFAATDLVKSDLARSIYRHASTLADANAARRLTAFFPRELLNTPSLSCDPLPPHSAVSQYDDAFFADCEDIFAFRARTRREREVDARMLARMIPDANVRHQIQALYDARPEIQRQFPEGVAQFAQVAGQLGEDFWDFLLPQFAEEGGGGVGGMPGQFMDFADLDDEREDNHDDGAGVRPPDDDHPRPRDAENHVVQQGAAEADAESDDEGEDHSDEEAGSAPIFPVRVWHNLVNRIWGGGAPAPAQGDDVDGPEGGAQD